MNEPKIDIFPQIQPLYDTAIEICRHPCDVGRKYPVAHTITGQRKHSCESEIFCHVIGLCESYSEKLARAEADDVNWLMERFTSELIAVTTALKKHEKQVAIIRQWTENLPTQEKRPPAWFEKLLSVKSGVEPLYDSHSDAYCADIARRMYPDWQTREGRPVSPKTVRNNLSIAKKFEK